MKLFWKTKVHHDQADFPVEHLKMPWSGHLGLYNMLSEFVTSLYLIIAKLKEKSQRSQMKKSSEILSTFVLPKACPICAAEAVKMQNLHLSADL